MQNRALPMRWCCLAPAPTWLLLLSVHHHPSKRGWEVQGKALSCLPEVVLPLPEPLSSALPPFPGCIRRSGAAGCLPGSCCWVFSSSDSLGYLFLRLKKESSCSLNSTPNNSADFAIKTLCNDTVVCSLGGPRVPPCSMCDLGFLLQLSQGWFLVWLMPWEG